MRHDYDLEVAEDQSTDLISVDFRKKLAWAHDRGSLPEWILHVLGRRGEHFSQSSLHLVLVDQVVTLGVHQVEECVEGFFEHSGALRRKLAVLLDLRELFLKQRRELNVVEVAVQAYVPGKLLVHIFKLMPLAEAQHLLYIGIASHYRR